MCFILLVCLFVGSVLDAVDTKDNGNIPDFKLWCENGDCSTKTKPFRLERPSMHCSGNASWEAFFIPTYGHNLNNWMDADVGGYSTPFDSSNYKGCAWEKDPNENRYILAISYMNVKEYNRFNDVIVTPKQQGAYLSALENTDVTTADLPIRQPTSLNDLSGEGCLDEMGYPMDTLDNRPTTCQSLIVFNDQPDYSPEENFRLYAGYQSFNRIRFDYGLYRFLTNTYTEDNDGSHHTDYLACTSYYNTSKSIKEDSACYQLVYPGAFFRICCCYNASDYHLCSVYANKFIGNTSMDDKNPLLRCFDGTFDSGGSPQEIEKRNMTRHKQFVDGKYKHCSIMYTIKKTGTDLRLMFEMKGETSELPEKGTEKLYSKSTKGKTFYCFLDPTPPCPERNTSNSSNQASISVKCVCNFDYCNKDSYSTSLVKYFQEKNCSRDFDRNFDNVFYMVFLPPDRQHCYYFIDRATGDQMTGLFLQENIFFLEENDLADFYNFVPDEMDVRTAELIIKNSKCRMNDHVFIFMVIRCKTYTDCEESRNSSRDDVLGVNNDKISSCPTFDKIFSRKNLPSNFPDTNRRSPALETSRCYVRISKVNGSDPAAFHVKGGPIDNVSYSKDELVKCMDLKLRECTDDWRNCSAPSGICCNERGEKPNSDIDKTMIVERLMRCLNYLLHPNIEEKINHYVTPAIQSCGAEAASFKDNICLQLPTQSGCVLTQTFSNEDRTEYECIRGQKKYGREMRDYQTMPYFNKEAYTGHFVLCNEPFLKKDVNCYHSTYSDVVSPNSQQPPDVFCCCKESSKCMVPKEGYGRKYKTFMDGHY